MGKTLKGGRLAHAYLLTGPDGVGKEAMALEICRVLHCRAQGSKKGQGLEPCGRCPGCQKMKGLVHPDLKLLFPIPSRWANKPPESANGGDLLGEEIAKKADDYYHTIRIPGGNNILIEQIRPLNRYLAFRPVESDWKVIIIFQADRLTPEAANALLHILEEPPSQSLFLLVSGQPGSILPTIRSRCQGVRFANVGEEEILRGLKEKGIPEERLSRLIAKLAGGSFGVALRLAAEDVDRNREGALGLVLGFTGGSPSQVSDLIEEWQGKDRYQLTEGLRLVSLWLRDAQILRELTARDGESCPHLVNQDRADRVVEVLDRFPRGDFLGAVAQVEKAVDLIDKNVYLKSILMNLAINLRALLGGK
ncbi:DNA polymerase III subunit delta' [candidate division KSB1 bacterium]|nr:DNA polymerase III subunit delta' [candidate division KSB1 bacterium]